MSPVSPPILTLRDVHHTYGGRTVLSIAELTLAPGEIALLVGENGSGKSTLLRIIAGMIPARQCALFDFCGGKKTTPPAVAYLHQVPYLFAGSVRANVEYGVRCCGLPLTYAAEAMEWAGVSDIAESPAALLSGGEQRRVALARVRALRPQLYLLDEPLTHLDDNGKARVRALLATLRQEGATAIISSHRNDLPATQLWQLIQGKIEVTPVA